MRSSFIISGLLATFMMFGGFAAQAAEIRPAQDPFESRRRDQEYRQQLRRQQELARQRPAVPTFTIPQPALNNRYYNPRFDRRFDRFEQGQYVLIPGHYQVLYGQMVYVPPHYEFVRW